MHYLSVVVCCMLKDIFDARFQEGNNLAFHPINRFIDSDEFQCLATTQEGKVEISPSAQFNIKCMY